MVKKIVGAVLMAALIASIWITAGMVTGCAFTMRASGALGQDIPSSSEETSKDGVKKQEGKVK
ncbi:MAG: hypothetical protein HZB29_09745 [Nitrospinae bacterium]|nr:hypothetical protein [Nitrospinota bacterium]